MSFDQLMRHAEEIRAKAVERTMERMLAASRGHVSPYALEALHTSIQQSFADIPELFQPFVDMPVPESFDPAVENLVLALGVLASGQQPQDPLYGTIYPANVVLDKLSGAESYIEDWSGRAAMEFRSEFITPFPSIVKYVFSSGRGLVGSAVGA